MRRWAFNLAAGLSLLLCVATAVLWAEAQHRWMLFGYNSTGWVWSLGTERNRLRLERLDNRQEQYPDGWFHLSEVIARGDWLDDSDYNWRLWPNTRTFRKFFGFRIHTFWAASNHSDGTTTVLNGEAVIIPFWFLTLIWLLTPGWRVISWLRARRSRLAGRCRRCGYDLRATPLRCPECGAVPAGAKP